MDLSIVVPLYDEEENVVELHARISEILDEMDRSAEMIFVDDGSSDRTVERLLACREGDPRVRVVTLRRNFGQTAAMRAGIELARGETIVTMDGDLQNDPKDVPRLLAKMDEGYDLVQGWRRDRKDKLVSRRLPSIVANRLIARVTRVPVHDNGCSLKAYRAAVIRQIPLYSGLHRFIPAMATLAGARIAEIEVTHHPRLRGKSKYGISRILSVSFDIVTVKMLIAFSKQPIRWFALLAAPFLALTAAAAAIALRILAATGTMTIVYPAVTLLFAWLVLSLLVTGLVGELVVATGEPAEIGPVPRVQRRGPGAKDRAGGGR